MLLATFLITILSGFLFRSTLKIFSNQFKEKSFCCSFQCFLVPYLWQVVLLLLEKLFTSRAPETILTRLEFWRVSAEQFATSPLLGNGFGLQKLLGSLEIEKGIYYPHNYLLESLALGGIIMTIPLIYCIFFPVINFHRRAKFDPSVFPLWLLGAQALTYSMHNGHLGDFPFFWMIFGLIAGSKYRLKNAFNSELAKVND